MTAPAHCRSPETCSVCLGVPAKRVELAAGQVLVDGVISHAVIVNSGQTPQAALAAKRGGRRTGEQRRKR